MKKSILPVVLLVSLISGELISITPAFAEATDKTVVIAPKDTTKDATNTNPDTTITTSDTPTTEAGSEWSGDIAEPAGTNISEPPIPAEAPAPSAPAKAEVTNVVTTVPATRPVATPVNTAPAPATQPEPAASTTEPDDSNTTGSTNTAESTDTTESTDAADSTDAAPYIEVPKTSFAERNRKITLMALISTALVFFSSIFIASAYSLFRLIRSERKQKEHESAVEATIRRHITRAE